ncbi:hypothetical protein A3746_10185 [Oleibacter sp. HI0075]|nr:hypothetical protein A3746_10185 [Oleibacter sp. HI0075]
MAGFAEIGMLNFISLGWLVFCWFGYAKFAHYRAKRSASLSSVLHVHRINWMRRMLKREIRVGDAALLANIERNVNFFASSCVLIIAGLLTALTATDKISAMLSTVSFVEGDSLTELEFKLAVLVVIFIYAYFTFTWSMRQFGFASVLVGAAPMPDDNSVTPGDRRSMALYSAKVIDQASHSYNNGLRAFYFSMAALSWFVSEWVFMGTAALITAVLYSREFRSSSLKALKQAENVGDKIFTDDKELYRQ